MLAQLHDIVAFDEDTVDDVAQNNIQVARRESMSKEQYADLHDIYELKIKLPVQEFQSTTDIQFYKFEKSQRIIERSVRKPFISGL